MGKANDSGLEVGQIVRLKAFTDYFAAEGAEVRGSVSYKVEDRGKVFVLMLLGVEPLVFTPSGALDVPGGRRGAAARVTAE